MASLQVYSAKLRDLGVAAGRKMGCDLVQQNKPTRVGFKFLEDGRKVRFAKRSGEIIDR